ncbi:putative DNA methyltransferase yeeA [Mesorhizobium plurifarium]|uniref:site-specific DNA-methyltransferase (adenine-specific) n=1 Tax=Mesorhizobium plurifarium TaxID=69974 RepID=A0A0K2W2R9_MESPL|nr:putative DNA methyltransferase yeeA [Mesorhizobium plurifarium]
MLGEPTPAEVDPSGQNYGFEVGASKTTGGNGFADVFKRGFFGWEYKGTKANLDTAFAQLQRYAIALDNPPLLIVSDIGTTIRIHTNWTNSVSKVYTIGIAELAEPEKRAWLKAALSDPDVLRPAKTRQELTEEVAGEFARLARSLRERGHAAEAVAHFINRLVFCMFAEDVKLLPDMIFARMLDRALEDPKEFQSFARDLFAAMKAGGRVGFERVAWFNGGLFDDDTAFDLTRDEIKIVRDAASYHWGDVDPSILGTLFERGLDPDKRSQLGAHYTDREKIMMIVRPVIVEPLSAEWEKAKAEIVALMEKAAKAKGAPATRARGQAQTILDRHLARLANFRVLDPACGSGNFLYLALRALKDLEHRAQVEAEALGLPRGFPRIGPEVVRGIEINPYAAELARVSVWIGEIQWMIANGFSAGRDPILKPLETIECRDALIEAMGPPTHDGRMLTFATTWPAVDAIIGNPPYLGAKLMKRRLGVAQTEAIRSLYDGRLPGFTDFVCYWFENARTALEHGRAERVGFVATNSIRKNTNLPVMHRIVETTRIFAAWPEEKWVVDGATVDVSLICFGNGDSSKLNGIPVASVNADLTTGLDLTGARPLTDNRNQAFLGIQKSGPFDVAGTLARKWISEPVNPNGIANAEVLKPYWNGDDVTGRPRDFWFIDLPLGLSEAQASLFANPFHHVATTLDEDGKKVRELRAAIGGNSVTYPWWQPWRPRPEMRSRIAPLRRYIVTPETSQYRLFVWLSYPVLPDKNLIVIPHEDDVMFGLLHSRFHELWALRKGSDLQDRPRYTHTSTFATFPFPAGLAPNVPAAAYADEPRAKAVADAARRLNELRENWLNPADLVRQESEVVPGFPDRVLPVSEAAAKELAKRTLTNLYNQRPAWLDLAHRTLDEAVAAAYGWPADLPDDEVLARLFALNQERTVT